MAKSSKGSTFERQICKQLSLWWTNQKRDDVFWRTAGSGARATQRKKSGQTTFGQDGDVQATDPIGQPLLDLCTIEIKRGYSSCTPFDIIDKPQKKPAQQMWEKWIAQAQRECGEAGSKYWMIISKRDRREITIAMPRVFFHRLFLEKSGWVPEGIFLSMNYKDATTKAKCHIGISIFSFNSFLELANPKTIKEIRDYHFDPNS
uniref:Uncharacterized protein n=1 Tax=viral metagenome TaxID=1070528 RepID=A0A6M3IXH7_9ZZZZ